MKERDIIFALKSGLKKSSFQINEFNQTDAEIININGTIIAVNMDDFSSEDHFPVLNPKDLGRNLITAAMSDLLAVGALPKFITHSFVSTDIMSEIFLKDLSVGIQKSLDAFGCYCIGGDVGYGKDWRYTCTAIGILDDINKLMTRVIPYKEGFVGITGTIGDVNASFFYEKPEVLLECRIKETEILKKYVPACIDTSDGLINAIETLSSINKNTEIVIDLDAIPYDKKVLEISNRKNILKEAFLFGSAGEYELLFFVPYDFEDEFKKGTFKKIGCFRKSADGNILYKKRNRDNLIMHESVLTDPREVKDIKLYIKDIITLTEKLFL